MSYSGQAIRDMNLFVDGMGRAGVIDEVVLPKVTTKTVDHDAGGMAGVIEIPVGLDKLEASFTVSRWDTDLFKLVGLTHNNTILLTFRGAMVDDDGVTPVTAVISGVLKEVDHGSQKKGEKVQVKFAMNASFYSLTVDNEPVYIIDMKNNMCVVGGNDINSEIRDAIGQ